jgi:hypothetical protein
LIPYLIHLSGTSPHLSSIDSKTILLSTIICISLLLPSIGSIISISRMNKEKDEDSKTVSVLQWLLTIMGSISIPILSYFITHKDDGEKHTLVKMLLISAIFGLNVFNSSAYVVKCNRTYSAKECSEERSALPYSILTIINLIILIFMIKHRNSSIVDNKTLTSLENEYMKTCSIENDSICKNIQKKRNTKEIKKNKIKKLMDKAKIDTKKRREELINDVGNSKKYISGKINKGYESIKNRNNNNNKSLKKLDAANEEAMQLLKNDEYNLEDDDYMNSVLNEKHNNHVTENPNIIRNRKKGAISPPPLLSSL